jgi:hypothetical protein
MVDLLTYIPDRARNLPAEDAVWIGFVTVKRGRFHLLLEVLYFLYGHQVRKAPHPERNSQISFCMQPSHGELNGSAAK